MGMAAEGAAQPLETVQVAEAATGVGYLTLYRPHRSNALSDAMFAELPAALEQLDASPAVRVVVIQGAGRHFCAGIDLEGFGAIIGPPEGKHCEGRRREAFRRSILFMQDAFSAIERCRKPVIAAIHGACIGGAVDLVTACDLRYCTEDAQFAVKEVDIGIVADLGTLQRLHRLVGEGSARELALTGRAFRGPEAKGLGLVSGCYPTTEAMLLAVDKVALLLAAKSPLALAGTKRILLHARDHSVRDSLDYTATWNSAMLVSDDVREAILAQKERRLPNFSRL